MTEDIMNRVRIDMDKAEGNNDWMWENERKASVGS